MPPASKGVDHLEPPLKVAVSVAGLMVSREIKRVSVAWTVGMLVNQLAGADVTIPVTGLIVPPVGAASVVPVVTVR